MSFMDAMKKVEKTEVQSALPKVNPLLAKLNAKQGDGIKKPNPLLKAKPVEEVEKAPDVEAEDKSIQQKAVEEAKKLINETEAPEAIVEEKQDSEPKIAESTEDVSEEVIVEETKVETSEVEEPVEPKKGNKRGGRKKTAKEPKVTDTIKAETDTETVEIFSTRISYEDALAAISHPFANEEFEALKQEVTDELNQIIISDDMNSMMAKTVNAQLAALYQKVWFEYQSAKTLFENLSQKDTGTIDVIKYTSIGDGANDAQRKKAGIEACMRFVSALSPEPVNLFELLSYTREQYNFFKGVMDHLSYKKDVMISMNAALKIEDKVLGSGTQIQ